MPKCRTETIRNASEDQRKQSSKVTFQAQIFLLCYYVFISYSLGISCDCYFVLQINSTFTFASLFCRACNYSASCFNAVFLSVKWLIIIWVQLAINIGAVKQVSSYFANLTCKISGFQVQKQSQVTHEQRNIPQTPLLPRNQSLFGYMQSKGQMYQVCVLTRDVLLVTT